MFVSAYPWAEAAAGRARVSRRRAEPPARQPSEPGPLTVAGRSRAATRFAGLYPMCVSYNHLSKPGCQKLQECAPGRTMPEELKSLLPLVPIVTRVIRLGQ